MGCLVLKNIGGNWVQSGIGMRIQIKGTNGFVYNRIARRLRSGSEDKVISFYEALKDLWELSKGREVVYEIHF